MGCPSIDFSHRNWRGATAASIASTDYLKEYIEKHIKYNSASGLVEACLAGNLHAVNKMFQELNVTEIINLSQGGSILAPVHAVAMTGHHAVLKVLIDHGADVNLVSKRRRTPLHLAAMGGHSECIKLLIDCGADCNMKTEYGYSAYEVAKDATTKRVVDQALSSKISGALSYEDVPLTTQSLSLEEREFSCLEIELLFRELALGNIDQCIKLLKECAWTVKVLSEKNSRGWTVSHYAADWGKINLLVAIRNHGVFLGLSDTFGITPAYLAVQKGYLDCLRYLLEQENMDINIKTALGLDLSHCAASSGYTDCLKFVLDRPGFVKNEKDFFGSTALHHAARKNNTTCFQALLNDGAYSLADLDASGKSVIELTTDDEIVAIINMKAAGNVVAGAVSFVDPSSIMPPATLPCPVKAFTHKIVFMSHNWGNDSLGRDNHSRVSRVNDFLVSQSMHTFFDQDDLRGNMRRGMVDGIESSKCFVVFITSTYKKKVNEAMSTDSCKYEFEYAFERLGNERMVVVVMEHEMLNTKTWGGCLGAAIGRHMYIDMTSDDEEQIEKGCLKLKTEIDRIGKVFS